MREHHVQCLLMGGQACVFYGAAEFSRDTDLAILAGSFMDGREITWGGKHAVCPANDIGLASLIFCSLPDFSGLVILPLAVLLHQTLPTSLMNFFLSSGLSSLAGMTVWM